MTCESAMGRGSVFTFELPVIPVEVTTIGLDDVKPIVGDAQEQRVARARALDSELASPNYATKTVDISSIPAYVNIVLNVGYREVPVGTFFRVLIIDGKLRCVACLFTCDR